MLCTAQPLACDGAASRLYLRQILRGDLFAVKGYAAQPGLCAQHQPLAREACADQGAPPKNGFAREPALADGSALQQQLGGRHQAMVGMVPAELEAGAVAVVGGEGVEVEGGLVHLLLLCRARHCARWVKSSIQSRWLK